MTLEITQAAKEHLIKLGYDAAYGARPLRRTIQNLIEDPLAEHLLLGRYNQGDTIEVDLDPDGNGLIIGHRGEDPGRSLTGAPGARVARVQSRFVCQSCGAAVPRWEGQCRSCGEWNTLVETVVRDEPRKRPTGDGRRGRRRSPCPMPTTATPRSCAARWGSASSTACSAAGSWPGRSCCSAASRASASPRSCSRSRPAWPRDVRRPVRDRRGVGGAGAAAGGAPRADRRASAAERIEVVAETAVDRIVELARRRAARAARRGLRPDRRVRRARRAAGERRPGPRGGAAADGAREVRRRAGRAGRARDQGRHARRAQDPRAPGRRRAVVEGDRTGGAAPAARDEEPVRVDRGGRRVRDGRPGARRGRRPGPRVPRRSRRAGARAASSRRSSRAPARCSSRCRRWSSPSGAPSPRRTASGIDHNRLALLVAVLGRRAGIGLSGHDVYANLAGGLSVNEPGLDLPLALALASSLRDRPLRRRDRRDRRGRAARRAAGRRRPRPTAPRGRAPRVHAGRRPALARPVRRPRARRRDRRGRVARRGAPGRDGRPRRRRPGPGLRSVRTSARGRCRVLGSGALAGARRVRDRIDRGEA